MLLAKKRVYELAKELEISSRDLMDLLHELEIEVKNHMSSLTAEQVEQVIEALIGPAGNQDKHTEIDNNNDWEMIDDSETDKPKKIRSKDGKRRRRESDNDHVLLQMQKKQNKAKKEVAQPMQLSEIELPESLTVRELAEKLGHEPKALIKKLISMGIMAALNQEIDYQTAEVVARKMGIIVKPYVDEQVQAVTDFSGAEEDDPENLQSRPPVVTVMGHVDHGKTSLLDAIRETKVTAREAGGITQHIGASIVEYQGKKIVFLDTPGHEAFTTMRARGAQVTDIAILVVAADDGVMPQTVEAINHAKAAAVPIIVALNKIDRANAQPERVKQQLAEYDLLVEEWGGDTICVPVSALQKVGIDELLEMVLLVAEMAELKANPKRLAKGIIIEAKLDKGRGPVATVLIKNGTLRVGDSVVAGSTWGRVRAMIDDRGETVTSAGPSAAVEVLGLSEVPQAGDVLEAKEDDREARLLSKNRHEKQREQEMARSSRINLEQLYQQIQEGEIKELNIIIKADVQGSVEALRQSLIKLSNEQVQLNPLHGGVGAITETDVMLAAASNALIIGFNVRPEPSALKAAEKEDVDIRLYRVIYDAIEDIEAAMKGLLDPEYKEVLLGRVEVRTTFKVPKVGTIAGCYVLEGKVVKGSSVRLVRDGVVIYEGVVESLRRFKDDVREVAAGYECGIGLKNFNDLKEGDIMEAYTMEEIRPT
ncbi:MAG: translation initiation factor IF-2 [bacterium]|jgi:translation initiation factor IF-2